MNQNFKNYLEDHFEIHEASGGRELKLSGECPFCGRDRYDLKLFVNARTGKGVCHHCGTGFNPAQFVMAHADCDYKEAAKLLYDGDNVSAFMKDEPEVINAPVWFPATAELTLGAREYLRSRGIGKALINHFRIKSCMVDTEVDGKIVRTANRIIIPVMDAGGKVTAWQGRDITGMAKPKYLFPSHFKRREYVFNIHGIPDNASYLIVCEGVFDVFGWWQAGFRNVVATFGKAISDDQLALIKAKNPAIVFIAWDTDAGWQKYDFCEDNLDTLNVRIIDLAGKDSDEMALADLLKAFKSARAYSWADKILNSL